MTIDLQDWVSCVLSRTLLDLHIPKEFTLILWISAGTTQMLHVPLLFTFVADKILVRTGVRRVALCTATLTGRLCLNATATCRYSLHLQAECTEGTWHWFIWCIAASSDSAFSTAFLKVNILSSVKKHFWISSWSNLHAKQLHSISSKRAPNLRVLRDTRDAATNCVIDCALYWAYRLNLARKT